MAYNFASSLARDRWIQCSPLREVSFELGYPIVVCDDSGAPVAPRIVASEDVLRQDHLKKWAHFASAVQANATAPMENRASAVSGTGVFASQEVAAGQLLGRYMGTVFTEEEWAAEEEMSADENFLFNLNDGAYGVVLDGSRGEDLNELKYLNHSCEPNVKMEEAFLHGQWHVLVYALRQISKGEELFHDFNLHTEDPEEGEIPCTCGAITCRGKLFRYYEW